MLVLALALLPAAKALATPVLPDLVEEPPASVGVATSGSQYQLIFASGADNLGPGYLEVDGSRASSSDPMVANQLVKDSGGGTITYAGVGAMQYEPRK